MVLVIGYGSSHAVLLWQTSTIPWAPAGFFPGVGKLGSLDSVPPAAGVLDSPDGIRERSPYEADRADECFEKCINISSTERFTVITHAENTLQLFHGERHLPSHPLLSLGHAAGAHAN